MTEIRKWRWMMCERRREEGRGNERRDAGQASWPTQSCAVGRRLAGRTDDDSGCKHTSQNLWRRQFNFEATIQHPPLANDVPGSVMRMWLRKWNDGLKESHQPMQPVLPMIPFPVTSSLLTWYIKDHSICGSMKIANSLS